MIIIHIKPHIFLGEFHVISCEEIRSVKRYIVIIDDMLSWKDHIDM